MILHIFAQKVDKKINCSCKDLFCLERSIPWCELTLPLYYGMHAQPGDVLSGFPHIWPLFW